MTKYIQNFGTSIAIGLEGNDKTELLCQFYSFWNHDLTSGELNELLIDEENNHYLYYIWSCPWKLDRYFIRTAAALLLNNKETKLVKGTIGGNLKEQVKQLAKKLRLDYINYDFFSINEPANLVFYRTNLAH